MDVETIFVRVKRLNFMYRFIGT